jgi:hypothetical protein
MTTLLIHAIECVAVSDSELTDDARAAINSTIDLGSTIATAAGGYGVIIGLALETGKAIFNAIGDVGGGPDQLYLSLSAKERTKKIWPLNAEYYEVHSGEVIRELSSVSLNELLPFNVRALVPMVGPLQIEFENVVDIYFREHDSSNDDFLGRLTAKAEEIGRIKQQVIGNPEEGSIYIVYYSVEGPRWVKFGGEFSSDLAATNTLDGQLAVFGRGMDNNLWWRRQINTNAEWEPNWNSLGAPPGGAFSSPAVALNSDNAIVVFVQGEDNAIWHRWQLSRNSKTWSDWVSLGGNVTSAPASLLDRNGCLVVFARGTDGAIWHRWQRRRNADWTSVWHSLGGAVLGAPSACLDVSGRAMVVVRDRNNAVWIRKQTKSNTVLRKLDNSVATKAASYGKWADQWEPLGGVVSSSPAITRNADNGLVVFARGSDNAVWVRWQAHSGAKWSDSWSSLYGDFRGSPAAVLTDDGRLEVFGVGSDGAAWHRWQVERNGMWF